MKNCVVVVQKTNGAVFVFGPFYNVNAQIIADRITDLTSDLSCRVCVLSESRSVPAIVRFCNEVEG